MRNVGDSELGHAIEKLSSHGLAPMGHVTRDDRQFCVAMERVDVGDGSRKPGMRVQTISFKPRATKWVWRPFPRFRSRSPILPLPSFLR